MAYYGSAGIFGSAVSMTTMDFPRQSQINSFFGVNGLESLDGGFRGRLTKAHGVLYGQSALILASVEGLFRSYNDGVARVLVDNLGTSWPNVKLLRFRPIGRVRQSPNGTFYRSYQALFLHLA